MFSAVLGLFSQDLAVDLGTTNTRIHQRGCGLVCREPTVVAVHTDSCGRRRVLAVGSQARGMLGRTPVDVEAIRPVRDGLIADFEVAEALLLHLIRQAHGRNGLLSPKMVIAVPDSCTGMERRAIRESCEAAGARHVYLVSRAVAAGLGADLPVEAPSGHMVIDVGGGSTEISVLSSASVVTSEVVPGGGEGFDRAIIDLLRESHGLLIGPLTAEALKIDVGAASGATHEEVRTVKGRCLGRGVPRGAKVSARDVQIALRSGVDAIGQAARRVLETTPPELAGDIGLQGIVLVGGGSRLRGLDRVLRKATGLSVVHAADAETTVVRGAGAVLDDYALLRTVAA